MTTTESIHPIKRIREALKAAPAESGLRQFSTSPGFAGLIGRSPGLIRNVECGARPSWARLAKLIEATTGVSSKWMLSSPSATDPIIDVKGQPWSASEHLDPLSAWGASPDWRTLLKFSPDEAVRLVVGIVETQLKSDIAKGSTDSFASVVSLLRKCGSFENPEILGRVVEFCIQGTQTILAQVVKTWKTHGQERTPQATESGKKGRKAVSNTKRKIASDRTAKAP